MQYSSILLALAASAAAAPAVVRQTVGPSTLEPAPLCEQFSVAFKVDDSFVSANAVKNGTSGIVLMGERLSVYPGTPAYFNTSNPNPDPSFNYTALDFVLDDGVYGAFAPDVGDNYGISEDIYLSKDYQQFEWLSYNGSISHKLYAAPNSLYACNDTLADGTPGVFLKFGVYSFEPENAGYPAGCGPTQVIQNFNIEGGATSPN